MSRFVPQKVSASYYVLDTETQCMLPEQYRSWSQALTAAEALNNPPKPAPAPAPCCDCAAKLKAAEDRAERYRHALAQIWRLSDCTTAHRYADEALFGAERAAGGEG